MDFIDGKKRKIDGVDQGVGSRVVFTKDELKRTLETLTKEQLVDFVSDVGSQDAAFSDEIRKFCSKDQSTCKLFVRGLAWETTSEALRETFSVFGEVQDCVVIMDKQTKKSKGYGFVRFKDVGSAILALREPNKLIHGRTTICNLAAAGGQIPGPSDADMADRKLFVSSLSYETSKEQLLAEFQKYGEVEDATIATDKITNKSKGYAFVTYKTAEGAKAALVERQKPLNGRTIQCKLAAEGARDKQQGAAAAQPAGGQQPQQPQAPQQFQQPPMGGYMGFNPAVPSYSSATYTSQGVNVQQPSRLVPIAAASPRPPVAVGTTSGPNPSLGTGSFSAIQGPAATAYPTAFPSVTPQFGMSAPGVPQYGAVPSYGTGWGATSTGIGSATVGPSFYLPLTAVPQQALSEQGGSILQPQFYGTG